MKLVIFDLDDTLIDFASTRENAYRRLAGHLQEQGIDSAAFLRGCADCERPLFALFEQGRLSREAYRERRFAEPLLHMGVTPDEALVARLNRLFMDCVNDAPLLYPDVLPVLQALRARGVRTALLTNGPADGQRRKLEASGLGQQVDHVAIGEETGFSKPLAAAFRGVVERFSLLPGEALMVGDSPELDYEAALQAGLAGLLLDRAGQHRDRGGATIRGLDELLSRLPVPDAARGPPA